MKTITVLMSEIQETQEILNKHKTDSTVRHKTRLYFKKHSKDSWLIVGFFVNFLQELRKEVVELRRSLQQSKVEAQFLREELRKSGGQTAPPAHLMEEKIQLLKEVRSLRLRCENCLIHYIYYGTF